jgi:hypothetical protein
LPKLLDAWFFTVASAVPSASAISLLLHPLATSRRTSSSRLVSDAGRHEAGTAAILLRMATFYDVALLVHVAAGVVALSVFWLPLVTQKGGRTPRTAGWVYVVAAGVIASTGIIVCGRLIGDSNPLRHRAGIFLLYVGLLAAASAHLGVRALRTKYRTEASRAVVDLAPPVLLVVGGLALAAFGLGQAMPLYVVFAALGAALGAARLRFWLTPPATSKGWFFAHMGGMGTSCITTVTAFFVVNAHRLGMRTFNFVLWMGPIVVGAFGLTLWTRYYRRRAEAVSGQV